MKKYVVLSRSILFLLLASIIVNPLQLFGIVSPDNLKECSNFTVKHGDRVFFGSNDDMHPDQLAKSEATIMIYPPNATGQGYAEFGYFTPKGRFWIRFGALNESGLAYGSMAIPTMHMNLHPEKPIRGVDSFFNTLMRKASSVEEVIEIAQRTDFYEYGDTWAFQFQFADATGDSVVISPGLDGELVFTRKPVGQAYLVSTNFNPGLPEGPKPGIIDSYERYDTAVTLLENDLNMSDFSEVNARHVLEAIHIEWFGSFAASSRVFDLKNGDIYLYHYAQFDDGVKLNLADELKKGNQQIRVRDLFSQEVIERGESRYKSVTVRDLVPLVLVIGGILSFLGSLLGLLFVQARSHRNNNTIASPAKLRLVRTSGISWTISFWSLLLLIINMYPPNLINPVFPMQVMLVLGPLGALGVIVAIRVFIALRKARVGISASSGDGNVNIEGVLR